MVTGNRSVPIIDRTYKCIYQLSTDSRKSFSNLASQQPCNLGFARIAEQGVPSLFSRFREESWYCSQATKRSGEMRTRLLLCCLRSNNFLVKKSFPLLKRAANIYQSVREPFYPHAKVLHSVYGSVNDREPPRMNQDTTGRCHGLLYPPIFYPPDFEFLSIS